jgi:hypothetical protein
MKKTLNALNNYRGLPLIVILFLMFSCKSKSVHDIDGGAYVRINVDSSRYIYHIKWDTLIVENIVDCRNFSANPRLEKPFYFPLGSRGYNLHVYGSLDVIDSTKLKISFESHFDNDTLLADCIIKSCNNIPCVFNHFELKNRLLEEIKKRKY